MPKTLKCREDFFYWQQQSGALPLHLSVQSTAPIKRVCPLSTRARGALRA
jgi:hypothetical protein